MDYKIVEKLGALHASDDEVAMFLDLPLSDIPALKENDPDFKAALSKGIEQSKLSLRRLQWSKAQAGDSAMLIWLGKQVLGQSLDGENADNKIASLRKPGRQPR